MVKGQRIKLIILAIFIVLCLTACSRQEEGTIDYSDCRQLITLSPDTLQQYYKPFTCSYIRRASGKIISSTCAHVDTYGGGLFGANNGKCETAYIFNYTANPDPGCSKSHPYLGNDNLCYSDWWAADMAVSNKATNYNTAADEGTAQGKKNTSTAPLPTSSLSDDLMTLAFGLLITALFVYYIVRANRKAKSGNQ